jgi:CBS-domain-containing membrane protein
MIDFSRTTFSKWEREYSWPTVMAAVLLLIIGLTAWVASQPWLFPSLGPTAYLLAKYPELPSSRIYNCIVGHLVGIASGFIAVAIFNAWQAPIVPLNDVTAPRIWAATVAVGLTVLGNTLLRSGHPPAAATTLLIALGTFKTGWDAVIIIIGVLLLTALGLGMKRLRMVFLNRRKAGTK